MSKSDDLDYEVTLDYMVPVSVRVDMRDGQPSEVWFHGDGAFAVPDSIFVGCAEEVLWEGEPISNREYLPLTHPLAEVLVSIGQRVQLEPSEIDLGYRLEPAPTPELMWDPGWCYITEAGERAEPYMITREEALRLEGMGFLVKSESAEHGYDTTALVWDELGLVGERALLLFDAILDRTREPV